MRKEVDRVNQNAGSRGDDPLETMHAIVHLYRSRQLRGLRDGPHELAHMEIKVLAYFARHPGATQSDLVTHSGRDKAQVARLIRGLRERGLLTQTADQHDRRSSCIELSEQGKTVFEELNAQGSAICETALAGLSETDRKALMAALWRIADNLAAIGE